VLRQTRLAREEIVDRLSAGIIGCRDTYIGALLAFAAGPRQDPNYFASHPEGSFAAASESAARRWKFAPADREMHAAVTFVFKPQPAGGAVIAVQHTRTPPDRVLRRRDFNHQAVRGRFGCRT
jgi:hypothetical protein